MNESTVFEVPAVTTPQVAPQDMNVSFLRHTGWLSQDNARQVLTIIGCGAVGSNVAMLAAKMGYTRFVLYDADDVEAHNLPNQAYMPQDIGYPKVEALKRNLLAFNPAIQVEANNCFFDSATHVALVMGGFVIVATDSMKSREEIFKGFDGNPFVDLLMEARIGFHYGNLNIVNPLKSTSMAELLKTILPDDQVPEGPCSRKICATTVVLFAAEMAQRLCEASNSIANSTPIREAKMVLDFENQIRVHYFQTSQ